MAVGAMIVNDVAAEYSTLVATSEAAGYEVEYLVNGVPSEIFKSVGAAFTIRWAFDVAPSVGGLALINHNLAAGMTVKAQFSSDNWGSIAEEFTLNMADIYTFATGRATTAKNIHYLFDSVKTYKYFGLDIDAVAGTVQIGEAVWGEKILFTDRDFRWGYNRLFSPNRESRKTRGGQIFSNVGGEQRGYAINFSRYPLASFETLLGIFRKYGKVFIPDSGAVECHYGEVLNDMNAETFSNGDNFAVEFMSHAIRNPQ